MNTPYTRRKKHENYATLYKLLLVANGSVQRLIGVRTELTFEEYGETDIEEYLKRRGFSNQLITEITVDWSTNRERAVKKIREYQRILEIGQAWNDINEARNHLYTSELYFSDTVAQRAHELLKDIRNLLINIELPDEHTRKENPILKANIEEGFNQLREMLRKEMGPST